MKDRPDAAASAECGQPHRSAQLVERGRSEGEQGLRGVDGEVVVEERQACECAQTRANGVLA
jgi:hypothetical protein